MAPNTRHVSREQAQQEEEKKTNSPLHPLSASLSLHIAPLSLSPSPAVNSSGQTEEGNEQVHAEQKRRKRSRAEFSNERREQIATMAFLQRQSIESINATLHITIDRNYLYQLQHQIKVRGTTAKKPKTGRVPIAVTEEDKSILEYIVQQHNEFTLKQIQVEFAKRTSKAVSIASIDRALTKLEFTLKMLTITPAQRNTPEAIAARKEYAREALLFDAHELIYIDEFGISIHSHRSRGRAKAGEKATVVQTGARSQNVSVIAAISPHYGLMHYSYHVGSTDSEKFERFILELMKKQPIPIKSFRFIMDNCSIHKTDAVKQCFECNKHKQTQAFIPSYSPHCNAIEEAFSIWTNHIKQVFTPNQTALGHAIDEGARLLTDKKCESFHKHVVRILTDFCMESKALP